jgi:hypothetical protein
MSNKALIGATYDIEADSNSSHDECTAPDFAMLIDGVLLRHEKIGSKKSDKAG